jgi:hypothetical protein
MLSLDKKSILKEIEVLIRSIKVHYDNIENEHRIPTIELELITSKIRKLHEKSIIYNHLHYLEEESNLLHKQQRNVADVLEAMKPAAKVPHLETPFFARPPVSDQPMMVETPPRPLVTREETTVPPAPVAEEKKEDVKIPQTESKTNEHAVNAMDLASFIGINDRFWFMNELFAGKAEELELALNNFSNTSTHAEARNFLDHLVQRFGWNKESEVYENFLLLLNRRFGKI